MTLFICSWQVYLKLAVDKSSEIYLQILTYNLIFVNFMKILIS